MSELINQILDYVSNAIQQQKSTRDKDFKLMILQSKYSLSKKNKRSQGNIFDMSQKPQGIQKIQGKTEICGIDYLTHANNIRLTMTKICNQWLENDDIWREFIVLSKKTLQALNSKIDEPLEDHFLGIEESLDKTMKGIIFIGDNIQKGSRLFKDEVIKFKSIKKQVLKTISDKL